MRKKGCGLLVLLVLFSAGLVSAEPLDNWHVRDPLPQVGALNGVVHGNNMFVAVEGGGVILTSFDGVLWDGKAYFEFTHCLVGVAYGDSTFVTVGAGIPDSNPVGIILTSSNDGMSWLNRPSGVDTWLIGATCGDSTFVAVGGRGTILTSVDKGATWEPSLSGVTDYILGVAYGNNTFVAVGADGMILTSSDGKLWESSSSGTNNTLEGVTYGNNTFVAVGEAGTVLTSSDGVDWESENSGTNTWLIGITYGNGTFVAVGDEGAILTSADRGAWENRISGVSDILYAVTYGNNTFVAVGDSGVILQSDPVVFPTPDLKIYDIYNERRRLFIKVGNVGKVEVRTAYLDIWLDGKRKWTYKLSDLEPNKVMIIQPAILCGRHTIKAVIDPKNAIKEVDESNNMMEKIINFK